MLSIAERQRISSVLSFHQNSKFLSRDLPGTAYGPCATEDFFEIFIAQTGINLFRLLDFYPLRVSRRFTGRESENTPGMFPIFTPVSDQKKLNNIYWNCNFYKDFPYVT